jgi:hypothetical protein
MIVVQPQARHFMAERTAFFKLVAALAVPIDARETIAFAVTAAATDGAVISLDRPSRASRVIERFRFPVRVARRTPIVFMTRKTFFMFFVFGHCFRRTAR